MAPLMANNARAQLTVEEVTGLTAGLTTALVVACALVLMLAIWRRRAAEAARRQRRANAPRVEQSVHLRAAVARMSHPPVASWRVGAGNQYAAFLSHYKAESASTARYLHDLMQRMLGGCAVYLDSSNLTDLRYIWEDGLRLSDTVVLLGTRGVLTRPWCLLELWEASRNQIPVIVVNVGVGDCRFDADDARSLIRSLETELEARNPGALAEVEARLQLKNTTLEELKRALLSALALDQPALDQPALDQPALDQPALDERGGGGDGGGGDGGGGDGGGGGGGGGDAGGGDAGGGDAGGGDEGEEGSSMGSRRPVAGRRLGWDPCSSDRLLLSATQDLIESMAAATERKLKWSDPLDATFERIASSRRAVDRGLHPQVRIASSSERIASSRRAVDRASHDIALSVASHSQSPKAIRLSLTPSPRGLFRRWMGGKATATEDEAEEYTYELFISYAREEAGAHARLLHSSFERELGGRRVFLDATDLVDLGHILSHGVGDAAALCLLQTRSVLRRPWVLLGPDFDRIEPNEPR